MLLIRIVSWVGGFAMSLYLAAALQIGPEQTDANLCKILRRVVYGVPEQCVPQSWDNWGTAIALLLALVIAGVFIFDVCKTSQFQACRRFFVKHFRISHRNTWADRELIELGPLACLLVGQPIDANYNGDPQLFRRRALEDAIRDGALKVIDMRGLEPSAHTIVSRNSLRAFTSTLNPSSSLFQGLRDFLERWDRLNPQASRMARYDAGANPDLPSLSDGLHLSEIRLTFDALEKDRYSEITMRFFNGTGRTVNLIRLSGNIEFNAPNNVDAALTGSLPPPTLRHNTPLTALPLKEWFLVLDQQVPSTEADKLLRMLSGDIPIHFDFSGVDIWVADNSSHDQIVRIPLWGGVSYKNGSGFGRIIQAVGRASSAQS